MAKAANARVDAVRRFNRFYTRRIGVLRKGYLGSPFSLAEARVLYELDRRNDATASEIAAALDLDQGYLSRVLQQFEKRGLVTRKASKDDARRSHLTLTTRGKKAFAPLDLRSQTDAVDLLTNLPEAEQKRLVSAMATIEGLSGGTPESARSYTLRQPGPGDFGWIVARHAELYWEEYRWGWPFEGICAQIVADFVNRFDAKKERCWIAEMNGENVGTVMLVKDDQHGVARLRLLLVDPKARGLKLGARLVEECVKFSRKAGYRSITLWTHENLTAARAIYAKAGFTLTSSEKKQSFGKNVVAEYWDMKL
ncbi:MAG TPA: helix-turn-helix domain-containing GNAT family N-acetyltransferase [Pseudolabrys sp.]|nr:helix-turn-helix domain-containing GNAT family N-acetyltransferase [Pseudolabrys sp.]